MPGPGGIPPGFFMMPGAIADLPGAVRLAVAAVAAVATFPLAVVAEVAILPLAVVAAPAILPLAVSAAPAIFAAAAFFLSIAIAVFLSLVGTMAGRLGE